MGRVGRGHYGELAAKGVAGVLSHLGGRLVQGAAQQGTEGERLGKQVSCS